MPVIGAIAVVVTLAVAWLAFRNAVKSKHDPKDWDK